MSYHATYKDNPLQSTDAEMMRRIQPAKIFIREIEAKFTDDNSVFSRLDEAFFDIIITDAKMENWCGEEPIKENKEKLIPQNKYVMGVDWAKNVDYTVIYVMNIMTGKIVYWERMQKKDYNFQCKKVLEISAKYHDASIVYDATGVGSAIIDILNNLRLEKRFSMIALFPKVFDNLWKSKIIQSLALRIETPNDYQKFIPNIPRVIHEMRILEMKESRLGALQFAAPQGEHDDCVMALALVNWLWEEQRVTPTISTTRFI